MTKLAEAIAKTVEAAKSGNDAELGSSIVRYRIKMVQVYLGKLFGF
jgi:hypothetical protein